MSSAIDKPKSPSRATLEIVAPPGATLVILDSPVLDSPALPIFEGAVPASGILRLKVPRFPLLVITTNRGRAEVRFNEHENFRRVDMRAPAANALARSPPDKEPGRPSQRETTFGFEHRRRHEDP